MARIKKQGLDYFPLDTDFMHQRAVRRLMKQHGDRAFTVLLSALSAIYGGEGYYVRFNDAFCEDLSTELFDTDARQVEDVLRTAVKCGLFDERLCREHGILTSAHIQEQYLYSSKRRRKRNLDERYRLVETDAEAAPARDDEETGHATQTAGNVTQTPENVTQTTEIATQTPQSKAQQSKAQQSKKKPLPQGSPDNGGTAEGDGRTPPPVEERETHDDAYWLQRVGELNPPADGRPRNYDNLLMEMQRWRVPPQEQYAIILKSGFGLIGHPVWQGISEIVKKPKDIRQPGRFLLSKCK
ncbi:MAG TPA: DUF4373 domain-containing protein [Candidatus Bacteroides intestinavium]|uniref:DUF4373 domain-containing protein n=1 Tax=Candidatus Bacteroides intestinavium TaxID=2838469 RepID=A0A9D2HS81_9BACE|nr:DUF4373 domain-containing protein [Candidatus Bacteroides intestinavium]